MRRYDCDNCQLRTPLKELLTRLGNIVLRVRDETKQEFNYGETS
jgi:hypothetical protein